MADPLKLLRQYTLEGLEIIERDDQIIFGDVSWPKSFETSFAAFGKGESKKTYYTLECLLFFLMNIHLIHPVYSKRAQAANKQAVRRPDRKYICTYFSGETATSTTIDTGAPLKNPSTVTKQDKEDGELVAKKPRNEKSETGVAQKHSEQLAAHGTEEKSGSNVTHNKKKNRKRHRHGPRGQSPARDSDIKTVPC